MLTTSKIEHKYLHYLEKIRKVSKLLLQMLGDEDLYWHPNKITHEAYEVLPNDYEYVTAGCSIVISKTSRVNARLVVNHEHIKRVASYKYIGVEKMHKIKASIEQARSTFENIPRILKHRSLYPAASPIA